jgi:hypothetical protein
MNGTSLNIQKHTIAEVDGLYSLNDLFHSSDSTEPRHRPSRWVRLKRTKALTAELDLSTEKRSIKSNGKAGTFVCRELVYSYAMHISPKFEITVIRAFDKAAQKKLKQAQLQGNAQWRQNRELGKLTRKEITDTIQNFVDFAKAQGSRGAAHYFTNITKLVNTTLSIDGRNNISEENLHLLSTAEYICEQWLLKGMSEQLPYKSIFLGLKHQMAAFKQMLEVCDET